MIFLPQDGSFTSFGVVKAPDAQPTQLGLEGYLFPSAALGPGMTPYSSFPGPRNPVLSLVAYHGEPRPGHRPRRSRSTRWTRTT